MQPGLVSITFRQLAPREIVALVSEAELRLVEWGGDVHVPHGDVARAREVGAMTRDAGLEVAAYGSYYRVGTGEPPAFEAVLESAAALGAPLVRVWAGRKGSAEASPADRERVADDARRICDLAHERGLNVAFEYHGLTLTDTLESALSLLEAVDRPNVRTLWQPRGGCDPGRWTRELAALLPWLAHLHVFQWASRLREPLDAGEAGWKRVLGFLAAEKPDAALLLEFVRDDSPEQFRADAAALRVWLAGEGAAP